MMNATANWLAVLLPVDALRSDVLRWFQPQGGRCKAALLGKASSGTRGFGVERRWRLDGKLLNASLCDIESAASTGDGS
jgi:hypothetical protein